MYFRGFILIKSRNDINLGIILKLILPVSFYFLNAVTWKLKIKCVIHIIFLPEITDIKACRRLNLLFSSHARKLRHGYAKLKVHSHLTLEERN